jgi:hypothetical protein
MVGWYYCTDVSDVPTSIFIKLESYIHTSHDIQQTDTAITRLKADSQLRVAKMGLLALPWLFVSI